MKRIDLTWQRFGRLTVVRYDHTTEKGNACWRCRCDCGNETIVRRQNLQSGLTQSCGCLKKELMQEKARKAREARAEKKRPDLVGRVFGMLTVISPVKTASWLCRCECGKEVVYQTAALLRGTRKSCGCGPKGSKRIDLDGHRFGKLVVLRRNENATMALNHPVFDCRCDCGREITAYGHDLRKGRKTSCGCDKKTPKSDFADFARRHGCSVCADRKDCDMIFCKYEKELIT